MTASVFGNVHLGYVVIETEKFSDWRRFGADAIGMHVDGLDARTMRFRMDDHECRFLLRRGPGEDVTAFGWQVDDHESFDRIVARVAAAGVPIREGNAEGCALRGVERLLRFPGPKGIAQEIFTTARLSAAPLRATSSFVTGEAGLGHVAITSTRPTQMRAYFTTVFDARLSDYIDERMSGVRLKARFLRVNERHHSVAIASVRGVPMDPLRTSIQHVNVQVTTLDEMVATYQRVTELGFPMMWEIGQHTNDRELSFYAGTPSGFEWEVGWNPIVVDESTWEPTTHQGFSIWGHKREGETIAYKLAQFRRGLASLTEREEWVPAVSGNGIADYGPQG
ncbi:VOC family protein [Rhodococcus sp. NPDC004095]